MSECFDNMDVCNIQDLTEALMNIFEQEWIEKVQNKVKSQSDALWLN